MGKQCLESGDQREEWQNHWAGMETWGMKQGQEEPESREEQESV